MSLHYKEKGVIKIKRSWVIPVLIAVLALGVATYWGYNQYQDKQQLEVYIGNKYQQSFHGLVENVEKLQVLLGKSLVSTSPRQNILILTDVWSEANNAQAELTRLPLAAQTVYDTGKFLSQVGDFAHVMARQNAEGKVLSEDNRKTLANLRQHSVNVADSLHQIQNDVLAGKINWVELVKKTGNKLRGDNKVKASSVNLDDINEEMTKVPTLIYDGPFSDHITERKPQQLTGENISKETARTKSKEFIDEKDAKNLNISDGTTVNGKIPSYNFQVKTGNGIYSVDITKKGGHLVSLLNNRDVSSAKISMKEAVDKAQDYLARIEYPNMEPTYSEVKDNVSYISFAYQKNDVRYYPDIINVQVAMDNGQILGLEALNYLMSHHERDTEQPGVTVNEVKEIASSTLEQIESVRLAVIPTPALREVFTYEVRGLNGSETYLIYINAKTGEEEQIMKVIKGEQGTFAL